MILLNNNLAEHLLQDLLHLVTEKHVQQEELKTR